MHYLRGGDTSGRILLGDRDVSTMSAAELLVIRGGAVAMVYQDPMSSLNPAIKVGEQIAEVIRRHRGADQRDAWRAASSC